MGYFSWLLADTEKPLRNRDAHDGPTPCIVLFPPGFRVKAVFEAEYDGYGRFCGDDFYQWVNELNNGPNDIAHAIDHECRARKGDTRIKMPKIVSADPKYLENPGEWWEKLPVNKNDPNQGYFDW